jgi:hypothetical protein
MNKMEMLQEMFSETQFERNIKDYMNLKKKQIQDIYLYFVKYKDIKGTLVFCNTLLSASVL